MEKSSLHSIYLSIIKIIIIYYLLYFSFLLIMGNSFLAIFNSHQLQIHKEVYYQFFIQSLVQRDLIYVYVKRIWGIILVQSNLALRNCLVRKKLELRNHFLRPICHLLHKDMELLALRNNFRATKKFLIANFDCTGG